MKKISQAEAKGLRKRVTYLENILISQKLTWREDWLADWVVLERLTLQPESYAKVSTARKLGHVTIIIPEWSNNQVVLYADKL